MPSSNATLHMMCGKIAAGKSTLAARLGDAEKTILIDEDRWIDQLYRHELRTLADYFERSRRLRPTLAPMSSLFCAPASRSFSTSHANTVESRGWMRVLFEEAGVAHKLHFLDAPDEVCRARMHARRAAGGDGLTDAEFDHVTSFFVAPERSEGFSVVRYGDS